MKDDNSFYKFQVFSTIFSLISGVLLHFAYEWSGNNTFVGLFSAVNESTWEHLKLIFFPMLITVIIGYFIFKNDFSSYICAKTIGIICAMLFTIIFFYTYTGVVGTNYDFLNIATFIIAVILGEYVTYILTFNHIGCNKSSSTIILILLVTAFFIFTFNPPKINLFKDPINNSYGIKKAFSLF